MAPQEVQFSPTKLIDKAFVGCVADLLEQAIARERDDSIRLINAREVTRSEREAYEQG